MTHELKAKYDLAAELIFKAKLLLDEVQPHLTCLNDSNVTRKIRTDLSWSHEDCIVMGLHRIGEALEDRMGQDEEFTPDWFSPPGDTIKSIIEHRNLAPLDLAIMMGNSEAWTESLLNGDIELTEAVAQKLSDLLGPSKRFWLNREATYRKDKKRITGQ